MLPSPGCLPEKVLTVSCRPEYSSRAPERRAEARLFLRVRIRLTPTATKAALVQSNPLGFTPLTQVIAIECFAEFNRPVALSRMLQRGRSGFTIGTLASVFETAFGRAGKHCGRVTGTSASGDAVSRAKLANQRQMRDHPLTSDAMIPTEWRGKRIEPRWGWIRFATRESHEHSKNSHRSR